MLFHRTQAKRYTPGKARAGMAVGAEYDDGADLPENRDAGRWSAPAPARHAGVDRIRHGTRPRCPRAGPSGSQTRAPEGTPENPRTYDCRARASPVCIRRGWCLRPRWTLRWYGLGLARACQTQTHRHLDCLRNRKSNRGHGRVSRGGSPDAPRDTRTMSHMFFFW
jgi:hypothetical protein